MLTIILINIYFFYKRAFHRSNNLKLLIDNNYIQILNHKKIYLQDYIQNIKIEETSYGQQDYSSIKISGEDFQGIVIATKQKNKIYHFESKNTLAQPDYWITSPKHWDYLYHLLIKKKQMTQTQSLKTTLILILFVQLTVNSFAQLATSGSETVANTTTSNNQQRPAVAMDGSGKYIVAWESLSQDGDGYGIYAQGYNSDGTVNTSEYLVNTTTANDQRMVDVAMNDNTNSVVVWQSYDQDGDNWGIYFQRYNSSFSAVGSETKVNTTTSGRQCMPKVAMDDNGNFAITWESDGDIYAAIYNSSGIAVLSQFQVNTTTSDQQSYPDITMDKDGDFVITWQSYNQDGDGFGIYNQRYNSAGVAQGNETIVNTTTSNQQTNPSISIDDDGNYIIVWTDNSADGDRKGIFGQLFNADGTTNGNEFQVNTTTTNVQDNSQVEMTRGGTFSVVWNSYAQDGQYTGIYNQSYNKDGSTNGAEMLVNTTTNYFQQFPAIALANNMEAVIIWQDGNNNENSSLDTDGYGVVFQAYSAAALPVELLYFYAEKVNKGVQLDWQTATELNNSHFEIEWSPSVEQAGTNGIDFKKIGEVAGAGTTNDVQFYDFLHQTPVIGMNYYRLKQFDFDGTFEYSDVLNIEYRTRNIEYRIFPNPTSAFITIENLQEGELVQVFSSNGQFIEAYQSPINNLSVRHLPKGTYFIKIGTQVKRVLIQ